MTANSHRLPIPTLERPDPKLQTLYILTAVVSSLLTLGLALPFALIGLVPALIRYHTLRYSFDEEGVGIRWGFFFRHEAHLTYDKIQDIHVNRGLLERWLGLGTVDIQTAAASLGAEISLVGLTEFDAIRDFLYSRMRSAHDLGEDRDEEPASAGPGAAAGEDALALLRAIRDEVHRLGERLNGEAAATGPGGVRRHPPESPAPGPGGAPGRGQEDGDA